jgi:hypothetical protein
MMNEELRGIVIGERLRGSAALPCYLNIVKRLARRDASRARRTVLSPLPIEIKEERQDLRGLTRREKDG